MGQKTASTFETYKSALTQKGYDVVLSALQGSIKLLDSAEKRLDGTLVKRAMALNDKSYEDLYEIAQELGVKGRSKMTKGQLKSILKKKLRH